MAKEGGGWTSTWFSERKPVLKQQNALINLPFVIDGDVVVRMGGAWLIALKIADMCTHV